MNHGSNLDLLLDPSHWPSWVIWAEAALFAVLGAVLLVAKAVAFVQCLMLPSQPFIDAQKLPKYMWGILLGLGFANAIFFLFRPQNIITMLLTIAMLVFFFDVKPAIKSPRV